MNAKIDTTGIRRATLADMPFIVAFAKEKYPDRDVEKGVPWMEWAIKNPDRLVLLGANSLGAAQVSSNYGFERRGKLDMLASRPVAGSVFEGLRMIRIMVAWAKSRGATGKFKLSADTGVDFKPFSDRLGGTPVTLTHYELPLD